MSDRTSAHSLTIANKRLTEKDSSLWGELAQPVAQERLGWIDLPERSRELLPALDALSAWARSSGLTRVVLSGMGGSSLAPEVIAAANKKELTLLDSTHPVDVRLALEPDPKESIFVLSSKSGTTLETLSHLKAICARLEIAQLQLKEHLIIISDPGSPLESWAKERDIKFFAGEPEVGGRFSALSIFGLLPSALLGVDCSELLDDAADMKAALTAQAATGAVNPAIALTQGIIKGGPYLPLPAEPLSDWIEQLVAESTGKDGRGIVPVTTHRTNNESPSEITDALQGVRLGGLFYLWEWSTALLGYALDVNPFDQPNVASAKEATSNALHNAAALGIDVPRTAVDAEMAIRSLFTKVRQRDDHYLALLSFTPLHDMSARDTIYQVRDALMAANLQRITLGFGPRYLHSTGQCHKGGPNIGAFLVLTVDCTDDYPIPGESYSFADLISAQALGDVAALREAGREVLHVHLPWDEVKKLSRALHEVS